MNKVLIFDLDGCVIDSSNVQKIAFFESYNAVVGDNNPPHFSEYIKHTGDSIENVLKKLGLPSSMATIFKEISNNLVDKVVINWDLIKFIQEMNSCGFKISICTGKDHNRVEHIFYHFGIEKYFDLIIGADDVQHPKPNKEPLIKILDFFKASNSNAIFVGDGNNDILCAQNANIPSILATWYDTNMISARPTYIAKTVQDLYNIVNSTFLFKI